MDLNTDLQFLSEGGEYFGQVVHGRVATSRQQKRGHSKTGSKTGVTSKTGVLNFTLLSMCLTQSGNNR